jgi:NAD(P)-dependent dehydrogenase (short-subunit alcohol dehydrogenase family)
MPRRRPVTVSGRTAVVTGAGSGIGRALAQRMARHGSPVALCDQNEEGLEETAESIGGPVLHRKLDVRDRQGMLAFATEVAEWAPQPLGMVVSNAGVTVAQTVAQASPEDDQWVFDINYGGVVNGTRAFLPLLLEQGSGALVNVSSVFGLAGFPVQSAYCASKFAVRGWTESLRHELRDSDVRAVTVHPGGIATNIVSNSRFHVDDRGGTDKVAFVNDFMKVARTTPDKAAAVIHRGVEKGLSRIRIGPDAYMLDWLVRAAPNRYYDVIKRIEPVVRRG